MRILLLVLPGAVAIALLGAFFVTVAEARILEGVGLQRPRRVHADEMHHVYLGALIVVLGYLVAWPLLLLGLIVMADDVYQHWRQVWCAEPYYRSPLHRLYGWTLWRLSWIRRLNRWLDDRL